MTSPAASTPPPRDPITEAIDRAHAAANRPAQPARTDGLVVTRTYEAFPAGTVAMMMAESHHAGDHPRQLVRVSLHDPTEPHVRWCLDGTAGGSQRWGHPYDLTTR